jgi:hypothetical protein
MELIRKLSLEFELEFNDVIFNKASNAQFLQVIHKATHWINSWCILILDHQQVHIDTAST